MKIVRYAAILAMAVLLGGPLSQAQAGPKTFQEWSVDKKLAKQMVLGNWNQTVKRLKGASLRPKKVGLISVMIWDFGEFEYSAMAHRYGGTYMQSTGLSQAGGNHFATKFAEASLPALKEAFTAHDMVLLTPAEFARTDAQKKAYLEFELPLTGLSKVTAKLVDRLTHNPDLAASAASFKAIPAHLFAGDKKALFALEELRKAMKVDAVLVICTETRSTKTTVGVAKIDLVMWGHNPLPKPPQKLAQIAWADGAVYGSGNFGKGFKGAFVAEMKKGKIASEDYAGYGEVVGTLADATLSTFDEAYEKGKPAP